MSARSGWTHGANGKGRSSQSHQITAIHWSEHDMDAPLPPRLSLPILAGVCPKVRIAAEIVVADKPRQVAKQRTSSNQRRWHKKACAHGLGYRSNSAPPTLFMAPACCGLHRVRCTGRSRTMAEALPQPPIGGVGTGAIPPRWCIFSAMLHCRSCIFNTPVHATDHLDSDIGHLTMYCTPCTRMTSRLAAANRRAILSVIE